MWRELDRETVTWEGGEILRLLRGLVNFRSCSQRSQLERSVETRGHEPSQWYLAKCSLTSLHTSLLWTAFVKFAPGLYVSLQCVHVHDGQSFGSNRRLGVAMSPLARRLSVISRPDSTSNLTRGAFGAVGAEPRAGAFARYGS